MCVLKVKVISWPWPKVIYIWKLKLAFLRNDRAILNQILFCAWPKYQVSVSQDHWSSGFNNKTSKYIREESLSTKCWTWHYDSKNTVYVADITTPKILFMWLLVRKCIFKSNFWKIFSIPVQTKMHSKIFQLLVVTLDTSSYVMLYMSFWWEWLISRVEEIYINWND